MATKQAFQEELNPFLIAKQQFNRAADYLELDLSLRHVLENPKRRVLLQRATAVLLLGVALMLARGFSS